LITNIYNIHKHTHLYTLILEHKRQKDVRGRVNEINMEYKYLQYLLCAHLIHYKIVIADVCNLDLLRSCQVRECFSCDNMRINTKDVNICFNCNMCIAHTMFRSCTIVKGDTSL
jgi:hypothetical protein